MGLGQSKAHNVGRWAYDSHVYVKLLHLVAFLLFNSFLQHKLIDYSKSVKS